MYVHINTRRVKLDEKKKTKHLSLLRMINSWLVIGMREEQSFVLGSRVGKIDAKKVKAPVDFYLERRKNLRDAMKERNRKLRDDDVCIFF